MVDPRLKVYYIIYLLHNQLYTLSHTQTSAYVPSRLCSGVPVAAGLPEYVTWKTRCVIQTEHKKKTPNTAEE